MNIWKDVKCLSFRCGETQKDLLIQIAEMKMNPEEVKRGQSRGKQKEREQKS